MSTEATTYFYALLSAICFSSASLGFADISRRISPTWMNAVKAILSGLGFGVLVLVTRVWVQLPSSLLGLLLLSGALGLGLGDIFLLSAYARMGSARTLILYGFQPLFIGVAAHFFFGQEITWIRSVAILFFLACLFTFSLEKFRERGHWEVWGLVAALLGVLLDNVGMLITRFAFDRLSSLGAFEANFVRCLGALLFFAALGLFGRVQLVDGWRRLEPRGRTVALAASFLGTFVSLCLYLTAVKIGHLASLSALGAASPILSSIFECFQLRKLPSAYLLIALAFFATGFVVLTWTS